MKNDRVVGHGYLAVGIMALFFAGFLLAVVLGASGYRNILEQRNRNYGSRSLNAYLLTALKAEDADHEVTVGDSEFGTVLEIASAGSAYARRIYLYDGELMEDYARRGSALLPRSAQAIGKTNRFSAAMVREGLYFFESDEGRVYFSARSGR